MYTWWVCAPPRPTAAPATPPATPTRPRSARSTQPASPPTVGLTLQPARPWIAARWAPTPSTVQGARAPEENEAMSDQERKDRETLIGAQPTGQGDPGAA